jgi:hypothetical protein
MARPADAEVATTIGNPAMSAPSMVVAHTERQVLTAGFENRVHAQTRRVTSFDHVLDDGNMTWRRPVERDVHALRFGTQGIRLERRHEFRDVGGGDAAPDDNRTLVRTRDLRRHTLAGPILGTARLRNEGQYEDRSAPDSREGLHLRLHSVYLTLAWSPAFTGDLDTLERVRGRVWVKARPSGE